MNLNNTDRDLEKLSNDDNFKIRVKNWLKDNPEIFVTEAVRTQERQNWLYESGRTREGAIVTWTLNSMHTQGLAVDVAFYGEKLYPSLSTKDGLAKWQKIADSAKKHGLDWGYDLWGQDAPHFQDAQTVFEYPPKTYRENAAPAWALPFIQEMIEADITTPPETIISEFPLYHLAGIISKMIDHKTK